MHRTFVPRLISWSSLLALLIFWFTPGPAPGQQQPLPQMLHPVNFAQPDIQQNAIVVQMVVGGTQTYMMTTRADLKKVENTNNKVLDVRGLKELNAVQFVALAPGRTSVRFTDVKDRVELV